MTTPIITRAALCVIIFSLLHLYFKSIFEKKDSSEIADIVNQSKSVLDIQHPNQTGLTMRTIEMIGMNKKLITTNASIVNYDFYNKKNILIIDRDNPQIDVSFFSTPYEKLNPEIYQKYSLSSWILDVLS